MILRLLLVLLLSVFGVAAAAQSHDHGGDHGGGHSGGHDHGEDHGGGGHDHGGQPGGPAFKIGRYIGHLQMEGRKERLAVQVDFFVHSNENMVEFPKMWAVFKITLGGYRTHEYITEVYSDVKTNFDKGDMVFDEPTNDLVIATGVAGTSDRPVLHGRVFSRSSAINGILHVTFQSDEPDFEAQQSQVGVAAEAGLAPTLQGQYVGKCDGLAHVLQIQTLRGSPSKDPVREHFDYQIVAHMGEKRNSGPDLQTFPYSTIGAFAGGLYDLYRGRLMFSGPSTTAIECDREGARLDCHYRIRGQVRDCVFQHSNPKVQGPSFAMRSYRLTPSKEQLEALPTDESTDADHLVKFLSGNFNGNLHHEDSDRYQPVSLSVFASLSTENPHNQNKVFISTTAIQYMGREMGLQYLSHRFEPRSFYIRPGFALSAPGTDAFIIVESWTKGHIRGVWYSRNFGRVGTIELIKDGKSDLPQNLSVMQSWQGQFEGEKKTESGVFKRWFQVIVSNLPAERLDSSVPFMGAYQSNSAISKIEPMDSGRYDPYTGGIGWTYSANGGESMVTGTVTPAGQLSMHWPPAPGVFAAYMSDFDYTVFTSLDKQKRRFIPGGENHEIRNP